MTNQQRIIRKAVEELEKAEPRLDYVRGMLESLVEDEPIVTFHANTAGATLIASSTIDEAAAMDAQAKAALNTIKTMGMKEE